MSQIPEDRETVPQDPAGPAPKLVDVRESIRYRRRAQEAEGRCAELEAELAELRGGRDERIQAVETTLADERRRGESLQGELDRLQAERSLERELIRCGARDPETALLVARERLAAAGGEEDAAEVARTVLEEKPWLKADHREEVPPVGRPSRTTRPSPATERSRTERLASQARTSGRRPDLIEYMRARRKH